MNLFLENGYLTMYFNSGLNSIFCIDVFCYRKLLYGTCSKLHYNIYHCQKYLYLLTFNCQLHIVPYKQMSENGILVTYIYVIKNI